MSVIKISLKRKILITTYGFDGRHVDLKVDAIEGRGSDVNASYCQLEVYRAFTVLSTGVVIAHQVGKPVKDWDSLYLGNSSDAARRVYLSPDNWVGRRISIPISNCDSIEILEEEEKVSA